MSPSSFGAQGNELAFLQNVAAAVSSLLAPAQVIDGMKMEREKKWALFFEKTPQISFGSPAERMESKNGRGPLPRKSYRSHIDTGASPGLADAPLAGISPNPHSKARFMESPRFASVVLDHALDKFLDYEIPEEFLGRLSLGCASSSPSGDRCGRPPS